MTENSLNVRIQHAVEHIENINDEQIQVPASTSQPKDGEIVFNQSRTNFKVGDGTTTYGNLPYFLPEKCVIIEPSHSDYLTNFYFDNFSANPDATNFLVFEPSGQQKLWYDYYANHIQIYALKLDKLNDKLQNNVEYTFSFNMALQNTDDGVLFICTKVPVDPNVDIIYSILNCKDGNAEYTHQLQDGNYWRGFQQSLLTPSTAYSSLKGRIVKVIKHTTTINNITRVYFFIY